MNAMSRVASNAIAETRSWRSRRARIFASAAVRRSASLSACASSVSRTTWSMSHSRSRSTSAARSLSSKTGTSSRLIPRTIDSMVMPGIFYAVGSSV